MWVLWGPKWSIRLERSVDEPGVAVHRSADLNIVCVAFGAGVVDLRLEDPEERIVHVRRLEGAVVWHARDSDVGCRKY